jgi:hypothetical protein
VESLNRPVASVLGASDKSLASAGRGFRSFVRRCVRLGRHRRISRVRWREWRQRQVRHLAKLWELRIRILVLEQSRTNVDVVARPRRLVRPSRLNGERAVTTRRVDKGRSPIVVQEERRQP